MFKNTKKQGYVQEDKVETETIRKSRSIIALRKTEMFKSEDAA